MQPFIIVRISDGASLPWCLPVTITGTGRGQFLRMFNDCPGAGRRE